MWKLLYLATWITLAVACPSVTFNKGNLVNVGSLKDCTFQLNGEDKEYGENEVRSMRFYGYVLMNCGDCTLGIVSSFCGCDDCIWCMHNEGITNCKSMALPIAASSLLTLLFTLFGVLIVWKLKLISKCLDRMERAAKRSRRSKILNRQKRR